MSSELTAAQIKELKGFLATQKAGLEVALAATTEGSRPVDLDDPIGRLSRMDAIQQQKMAQANRDRMRSQLRLTVSALESIEDDEYGECRVCEEPIGYRRLTARPESPVCIACQSAREQR